METIYFNRFAELKRERKFLERKLHVKIKIKGRRIELDGNPLDKYGACCVLEAINLGFSAQTASLIVSEDFVFERINIKDYTRRKDLKTVRGRIIGTHGKTKDTIEHISGCEVKIKENTIGVIGPAENIEYAVIGITNIIRGTKQTNVYKYLERINTGKNKKRNARNLNKINCKK